MRLNCLACAVVALLALAILFAPTYSQPASPFSFSITVSFNADKNVGSGRNAYADRVANDAQMHNQPVTDGGTDVTESPSTEQQHSASTTVLVLEPKKNGQGGDVGPYAPETLTQKMPLASEKETAYQPAAPVHSIPQPAIVVNENAGANNENVSLDVKAATNHIKELPRPSSATQMSAELGVSAPVASWGRIVPCTDPDVAKAPDLFSIDLFMRTYINDMHRLNFSLLSIKRFGMSVLRSVSIVVPEPDVPSFVSYLNRLDALYGLPAVSLFGSPEILTVALLTEVCDRPSRRILLVASPCEQPSISTPFLYCPSRPTPRNQIAFR